MFVSTDSRPTSCHEFASQIGLAIFFTGKTPKGYRHHRVPARVIFFRGTPKVRNNFGSIFNYIF